MIKNTIMNIAACTILLSANNFAIANDYMILKKDTLQSTDNNTQKIIDDFYAYAGTIKPEIREEIKKYRIEIVEINKKKRELYNNLSQEAQNFLAEEQKYKKKLSLSKIPLEKDNTNKK